MWQRPRLEPFYGPTFNLWEEMTKKPEQNQRFSKTDNVEKE